MPDIDIADLLRRALRAKGCSDQQVGSFDMHSNIELELLNMPSLNLERVNDDFWFWSVLDYQGSSHIQTCAPALLSFLLDGAEFARTGQMQLLQTEDRLELRSMIGASAFENEHAFGQALEEFLGGIEIVKGILGR
ncbi:Invasion protein B family [Pseudomonas sp. NPDC090202]|uniref:InvB/SpaK family type III secretion system chaperone n=1 Tax=unclassified Pseudomonas TaxID=196821 RepID=UPI003818CD0B